MVSIFTVLLILTSASASANQSSFSQDIPIKSILLFQPEIETYSISKLIWKSDIPQIFSAKVDKEYFVRHWTQNLHDGQKQNYGRPSFQEKQINELIQKQQILDKDQNWVYRAALIVIFVMLMFFYSGSQGKRAEQSQSLPTEENQHLKRIELRSEQIMEDNSVG